MHLIETASTVAAVALLGVLGWAVFVHFRPYRECRWCHAFARLRLRCWRCKGSRMTRRIGAKQVHKVKLSLRQAWEERS